ncbi:hypothetical protein [Burkholderia ambifaria]|uniref:hypothetical protein n=1 Tax=Burkholderia ambifaria TaxID=152480 RepID=UPI00158CFAEE|nr:hypothetical protein [Burkholderia ambifaria]WDR89198.1 hypothetical protein OR986_25600 [Burkholderia ambifaria]WDS01991.1 hypothetical protein OR985_30615 [Burkholderia ambifaria]
MKNEHRALTHLFATVGALTERGGRVTTATSGLILAGLEVACVGVGSERDNGDTITGSPKRQGVASSVVFSVAARSYVSR